MRRRDLRQDLEQARSTLVVAQMEGDLDTVPGLMQRINQISQKIRRIDGALSLRPVHV
jgi:hypothetical protein